MSSAALASHRTPCRCNLTTAVLPHWAVSCCSTLPHRQHHPSALHSTTLPHSVLSLHLHVVMRCALTLAQTLVHTSWHEHAEDRRHHHPPKASMQLIIDALWLGNNSSWLRHWSRRRQAPASGPRCPQWTKVQAHDGATLPHSHAALPSCDDEPGGRSCQRTKHMRGASATLDTVQVVLSHPGIATDTVHVVLSHPGIATDTVHVVL
jgi:hypothetical protein